MGFSEDTVADAGLEGGLDDEVTQKIRWLNTLGGFDGKINSLVIEQAVADADRSTSFVVQILDQLEEKQKKIEDPTAFVVFRLRAGSEDLLNKVQYLNDCGNLTQNISYEMVAKAARRIDMSFVMKVLEDLEGAEDKIKNPTSYVAAALQRRRNTLLKRMAWLNEHGGLKKNLWFDRITDTIESTNADMGLVLQVFKALEERKELEAYPTAFVTEALKAHHAVRKRISWFNTRGKLQKPISFEVVMESATAQGITPQAMKALFRALDEFEEKKKDGLLDAQEPTEAILHELRNMTA